MKSQMVAEYSRKYPFLTYDEIGRQFGVTKQRVCQVLKEAGFRKPPSLKKRCKMDLNLDELLHLYYDKGLTLEAVGKRVGCASCTVGERLSRCGFHTRHHGMTGFRSKPYYKKAEPKQEVE